MPEYLAPGVYVEETSFRTRSIEGVGTTTTGFVGPTRYGPLFDALDVITSLQEFEVAYGDRNRLVLGGAEIDNYMWHAARMFFEEGGKRLYVKRVYNGDPQAGRSTAQRFGAPPITVRARHPGAAGDQRVRFTVQAGHSVLSIVDGLPAVRGIVDGDVVMLAGGSPGAVNFARAESYYDATAGRPSWRFQPEGGSPPDAIDLDELDPANGDSLRVVTVSVSVTPNLPGAVTSQWLGLPLDPRHSIGGAPDSMFAIFSPELEQSRGTPITIETTLPDGIAVFNALSAATGGGLEAALFDPSSSPDQRSIDDLLTGGSDGALPTLDQYAGEELDDNSKTGLVALEDIEDISIVATPGATRRYEDRLDDAQATVNALISHAARMRYRIAVVDSGSDQTLAEVRAMRAKFDSNYAALYYPWIRIMDPVTGQPNYVPPSGAVAGIYARNDVERAVYKAPANEVVNTSIGFERILSKSQQEVLNPEGINCFRYFPGRGYRLWGARLMSSDSEWKYVNLRRYFAFLEHSIDRGTQWAVFEPNGERLWAAVRGTIEDFLLDQWQNGALLGDKPDKAYFVRCDRSTMTQNDLDNGRLVCLIGVAPLRPAEFVIFRIGQWTADRRL
jgi:phage tail sheath protein FI